MGEELSDVKVGDIVTLLPFEDQPTELAYVVGVPEREGDPYTVRVTPKEFGDDGLREVPAEQIG